MTTDSNSKPIAPHTPIPLLPEEDVELSELGSTDEDVHENDTVSEPFHETPPEQPHFEEPPPESAHTEELPLETSATEESTSVPPELPEPQLSSMMELAETPESEENTSESRPPTESQPQHIEPIEENFRSIPTDGSPPAEEPAATSELAPESTVEESPSAVSENSVKETSPHQFKTALWLFVPIIVGILGLFLLSTLYPQVVSVLLGAIVTLLGVIVVTFFVLGIFVIIGLREQARTLLSLIFEGGVKYIDFAQTISEIWEAALKIIKEFVLLVSPVLAGFLAILFYYLVMYVFRAVGSNSDLTLFTIILTIVLASITALLGQTRIGEPDDSGSFRSQFSLRFGRILIDGIEIATLLIFLTIDARHPFFLPKALHGEIRAEAFGMNFMQRGIVSDGIAATIRIAGAAVIVEIIRKIYRLVASVSQRYKLLKKEAKENGTPATSQQDIFELIRQAARSGFKDNLDDFTKFLGFTTILIFAFFFFPRLKLLSLLVFNISNLGWDLIFPQRVVKVSRSDDLLSRTLVHVFKL